MKFPKNIPLEALNAFRANTLVGHLGIEITNVGEDFLEGTMPVDERTHQPAGMLHGGASVVLAETLGSIASHLLIDRTNFVAVGLEVNANHLKGVKSGLVTGTARPIHIGRQTHVWDIKICNTDGQLICISRLTMAIIPVGK